MRNKIKVYYKKRSYLCDIEIKLYKKICDDNVFEWIDDTENKKSKISELKLINNNKEAFFGLDAIIALWNQIRFFNNLAKFLAIPWVYKIFNYLYKKINA